MFMRYVFGLLLGLLGLLYVFCGLIMKVLIRFELCLLSVAGVVLAGTCWFSGGSIG